MTTSPRLPLAALHQESGARMLDVDGFEVVGSYGDPAAEAKALRDDCGVVDRSWVGRLEFRGEDRLRFLNGLVSNDVVALEAGSSSYGFFTNIQGRILSDVYVLALEDRLWLEVAPGRGSAIKEHLEIYRVADRVEVLALDEVLVLSLLGPLAGVRLDSLGVKPCEVGCNGRVAILGSEVQIAHRLLFGVDAFDLWVSASIAGDLWRALSQADPGLTMVGFEALEQQRVVSSTARFGRDYDSDNLPQETGLLEQAVSFEKGCYLGQEIVARVHYRGTPKRELRSLEVHAAERPPQDSRLLLDGAEVGRLSSVAYWPCDAVWSALSVIDRRALDGGTKLTVDGVGEARVVGEGPAPRS